MVILTMAINKEEIMDISTALSGESIMGFCGGVRDAFTLTAQQQYKKDLTSGFRGQWGAAALARVPMRDLMLVTMLADARQSCYSHGVRAGTWLKNTLDL